MFRLLFFFLKTYSQAIYVKGISILLFMVTLHLSGCGGTFDDIAEYQKGKKGPAMYQIGGSVSGLADTVTIRDDSTGEELTLSTNGSFAFDKMYAELDTYRVSITEQPSGQKCQALSAQGRVYEDVTSITIQCADDLVPTSTSLGNCPDDPTNKTTTSASVEGTNLLYYSYKVYLDGQGDEAKWSGRVDADTPIVLTDQTFDQDGEWKLEARGINAVDTWEDETNAVSCSWELDTHIAGVEESELNPGTTGDQSVSNDQADDNLEESVIVDVDGDAGNGDQTPIDSDPESSDNVNNTGQVVISDGTNDSTDYTQARYLVLDDSGDPVSSDWSDPLDIDSGSSTIPSNPLSDGEYTLLLLLGDEAGNWMCQPADASECQDQAVSRQFVVDTTPPVLADNNSDVSISGLPPDITNSDALDVTLTPNTQADGSPQQTGGTELTGYSYCLSDCSDASNWTSYPDFGSPISESSLSSGDQTIQIKIKDAAGNESSPYSYSWAIDTSALVAELSGVPASPSKDSAFDVSVGCGYDGWDRYKYKVVDGSTCGTTGYTEQTKTEDIEATTIADGDQGLRTLCVLAGEDESSWQSSDEGDITKHTFMADRQAPNASSLVTVVGGLMPESGSTLNKANVTSIRATSTSDIQFTVASDGGAAVSHYRYRVSSDGGTNWTIYDNGGSWYSVGEAIDLKNADLPDSGDYNLQVEIVLRDGAGNEGSFGGQGKVLSYNVDQTAPDLPTDIQFGGAGTADPGSTCAGSGSALYDNPLTNESVCAYDLGRVDFDNDLTVTYSKPSSWSGEEVTLEFTLATSPNYQKDDGHAPGQNSFEPGKSPYGKKFVQTVTGEPDSYTFQDVDEDGVSYYIKLRAKDEAGNWSEYSYGGDKTEYDEEHNIESVGLLKAIVKDAAFGTPVNGVYVGLYDPNGNCLGALPTGGSFGDGKVQALVRKGDNYFTGKVTDLNAGDCNMSSGFDLSAHDPGYEPAQKNNITSRPGETIQYSLLLSPTGGTSEEKIVGQIVDANDGAGVTNANIKLYKWDGTLVKARWCDTTDPDYDENSHSLSDEDDCSNSQFVADTSTGPETGEIPAGTYTGKIYKEGYFPIVKDNIVIDGSVTGPEPLQLGRIALCGVLVEPHVRVIVQWGKDPKDLDLHLVGPSNQNVSSDGSPSDRFHIYWQEKNFNENSSNYYPGGSGDVVGDSTTASLVQDKIESYGPEAINLYGYGSGYAFGSYNFSLYNWTHRADDEASAMEWYSSPISARIFDSQGLVMEVPFPQGAGAKDTWRMFTIDIQGVGRQHRSVHLKNQFVDIESSSWWGSNYKDKQEMDW